jgi:hypothetical protein
MHFVGRTEAARNSDDICQKTSFAHKNIIQLHSTMLLWVYQVLSAVNSSNTPGKGFDPVASYCALIALWNFLVDTGLRGTAIRQTAAVISNTFPQSRIFVL